MYLQSLSFSSVINRFNNVLLNPLNCAESTRGKLAYLSLSIFLGFLTLGTLHLTFYLGSKLCCRVSSDNIVNNGIDKNKLLSQNKFNKVIGNIENRSQSPLISFRTLEYDWKSSRDAFKNITGKDSTIDTSYRYPPFITQQIDPNNFVSAFPKGAWLSLSPCYLSHCEINCTKTLESVRKEIKTIILCHKEVIEFLNKDDTFLVNRNSIQEHFENLINHWTDFLMSCSSKSFHELKTEDGATSYALINDEIKDWNKSRHLLSDLSQTTRSVLLSCEAQLGITAKFREYLKMTFQGIRGEIEMTRGDLAKRLDQCLDYFTTRNFKFGYSDSGGEAFLFFDHISTILYDPDFIGNIRNYSYELRLKENENDRSEQTNFCSIQKNHQGNCMKILFTI